MSYDLSWVLVCELRKEDAAKVEALRESLGDEAAAISPPLGVSARDVIYVFSVANFSSRIRDDFKGAYEGLIEVVKKCGGNAIAFEFGGNSEQPNLSYWLTTGAPFVEWAEKPGNPWGAVLDLGEIQDVETRHEFGQRESHRWRHDLR